MITTAIAVPAEDFAPAERDDLREDEYVEYGPWFAAVSTKALPRMRGTGRRVRGRQVFAPDVVNARVRPDREVELRYRRWHGTNARGKAIVFEAFEIRGQVGPYCGEAITVAEAVEYFEARS